MAINNISQNLKSESEFYAAGATIPANTSATSSSLQTGQTNGNLEATIEAKTEITLADTKTISFKLSTSATEAGTYVEIASASVKADGSAVYGATDVITSVPVPTNDNVLEWTKLEVSTDDSAITGTYDAYIKYLV